MSTYSESCKREAVAKAEASRNVSQTARKLGIHWTRLRQIVKSW